MLFDGDDADIDIRKPLTLYILLFAIPMLAFKALVVRLFKYAYTEQLLKADTRINEKLINGDDEYDQ